MCVRKREVKVERKRRKWTFSVNQNRSSTKRKREDDDDPKKSAKAYVYSYLLEHQWCFPNLNIFGGPRNEDTAKAYKWNHGLMLSAA